MESGQIKKCLSTGDETILIADDEESVLEITQTIIERMGYKTISVSSGESVLKIFMSNYKTIDLVLLDLDMPGMGGEKCLQKLMTFKPDSKVLLTTGYADADSFSSLAGSGACGIIYKPYSIHALSKIIRGILDG